MNQRGSIGPRAMLIYMYITYMYPMMPLFCVVTKQNQNALMSCTTVNSRTLL
jgi:hypothetical protein